MNTPTLPAVHAYLDFNGSCAEALEFYKTTLGAQIDCVMKFKENPDMTEGGSTEGCAGGDFTPDPEKVMHSSFRIGDTMIMASDCRCEGTPKFCGFSLSLSVKDDAEANRLFTALSAGGKVDMPLGKTFFSPCFGLVTDRFGVSWMVIVPQPM